MATQIQKAKLNRVCMKDSIQSQYIVYNDDFVTFNWVITTLCNYLNLTRKQAK